MLADKSFDGNSNEESKDESSNTIAVTISLGVVAAVLILCLVASLLYHMHNRRVAGTFSCAHTQLTEWYELCKSHFMLLN